MMTTCRGLIARKLAIDMPQKLQGLLVPMSFVKVADDFPLQQIEGGGLEWSSHCACNRASWFRSGASSR